MPFILRNIRLQGGFSNAREKRIKAGNNLLSCYLSLSTAKRLKKHL